MNNEKIKAEILDAAEKVIRENGLPDTKTDDIARYAGVSKGSIFYHFPTKKDVLLEIVNRYERVLYEVRDRIYDELPEQPSRRFKALILALIEHPRQINSSIIAMLGDKDVRQTIHEVKTRLIEECMSDAAAPEMAVRILLVFDGIWLSEIFEEKIYSREMIGKIVNDLLASLDILRSGSPAPKKSGRKSRKEKRP